VGTHHFFLLIISVAVLGWSVFRNREK